MARPKKNSAPAEIPEGMIEVQCLRRCGLEDRTTEEGEIVFMPKDVAIKLQDSGAVKVVIR